MLDPASWRQHAEHLPQGGRTRVDHDCGAGRTLLISNKHDGYSAWCFRCGEPGFIPHPAPSLQERLAALSRIRQEEDATTASPDLPEPRVQDPQDWPDAPRIWLYKAGLSNDDITSLGFYYCPRIERVVMPVLRDGRVVYWQARGFRKERAKYINPPVDRATLCAKFQGRRTQAVLVLTEDILSAYRVARLTTAWSIMGTSIPDAVALDAARQGVPIVVMLDPDGAGQRGRAKVAHALRLLGAEVHVASSSVDPKYLTIEGTRSCLIASAPALQHLLPSLP